MHVGQYRVSQAAFSLSELMRSLPEGIENTTEAQPASSPARSSDQPQARESTKIKGRACPALSDNIYAKDHPGSGVSKC